MTPERKLLDDPRTKLLSDLAVSDDDAATDTSGSKPPVRRKRFSVETP